MENRIIVGVVAMALIAAAALSVLTTMAYPICATGSTTANGDQLQTRLQDQDRLRDGSCGGTCDGVMTQARVQTHAQLQSGTDQCVGGACAQYQLRLENCLRLSSGDSANGNALKAQNQLLTQTRGNMP